VASLESLTAMCFPVIGDLNITVADTVTHFCLNLLTRGRYIDDAEVLIVTVKLLSAMLLQPSNVARVVQHSGIEAFIAVIGRHAEDSVLIQECVGAIEIISRTSPGRGRCEAMSGAVRSKRVVVAVLLTAEYALIIGENGGKELLSMILSVYSNNPSVTTSAKAALDTVESQEALVRVIQLLQSLECSRGCRISPCF
jgi:hypothetical protein